MTLSNPDLALRVLDWVLAEQMAGRSPTSLDVARHFEITAEEAEKLKDELMDAGEFD